MAQLQQSLIDIIQGQFRSSNPFDTNGFLFNLFMEGSYMYFKNHVSFLLLLSALILPFLLSALPQDLEVFTDFEDISGEGEFFIGEEPNRIKLVGFTVETLEDPALLHSGTKAITLGPGQEGVIVSERGIDEIQFYAAENTGAGRIEPRGNKVDLELFIIIVLAENGIVEGLPTNISPSANPPLQSFVSDSDMFLDSTDFDFLDGIKELKIKNVSGKFSLDDLGFTIMKRPSNNTVFTTFEDFSVGAGITAPIIVGELPISATFMRNKIFYLSSQLSFFTPTLWLSGLPAFSPYP